MSAPKSSVLKLIVEEETLRLKCEGWSFAEIAAWLNQQLEASFGTARVYVSRSSCRRALKRAMSRLDKVDSQESGRLDFERCEAVYKAVATRAMRGDVEAAQVALRALRVKAEIRATNFAPASRERQDMQRGYAEGKGRETSIELTRMHARVSERRTNSTNRSAESKSNMPIDEENWKKLWEEFRSDHRLLEYYKVSSKEIEWLRGTAFFGQLNQKRDFIFLLQQLRAGLRKNE